MVNRVKTVQGLPYHWLLPLMFFCIGLIYLYASPHFESPDSIHHVGVIKWIAEHGGALPVQSPDHEHLYKQEASQPPLYYLLMTPLWLAIDNSDFDDFYQPNPLANVGHPTRLGNRNRIFYRQPYPPDLQGTSLAIYIIRLATLGMGTVTIFALYQSARTIRPHATGFAVVATALAAFQSAIPVHFLVGEQRQPRDHAGFIDRLADANHAARWLPDETQSAACFLDCPGDLGKTKRLVYGLAGRLGGDLAGFSNTRLTRADHTCCIHADRVAGHRELVVSAQHHPIPGAIRYVCHDRQFWWPSHHASRLLIEEFEGFRRSYWGLFGWFSNFTNEIHYHLMDLLTLLSIAGLPVLVIRNRRNPFVLTAFCFLAILVTIGTAMFVWWTLQTTATQGRLMFPFIAAISLLMAAGLSALRIPAWLISLPMLAFSLIAPFLYIKPMYDHPPQVDRLPESAVQTFAQWEDITLIGYEVPARQRWSAGDEIPIVLYWRPLAASEAPLSLFISLITSQGEAIATLDTFPGWGTLPTTWWIPNSIYRDEYILRIPEDAKGYSSVQLHIGWRTFPQGSNLLPEQAIGGVPRANSIPIGAYTGPTSDTAIPTDATPNGTVFGDTMQLTAFRFVKGDTLELYWQLLDELSGDWRVLAIVFAEHFQPDKPFDVLMQADRSPEIPLGYLRVGETLRTVHAFDVPEGLSGEHSIYIAWYNEQKAQRLSLPFPSNMLELPKFTFNPRD